MTHDAQDARDALKILYAAYTEELAKLSPCGETLRGEILRPVFGDGPVGARLMFVGEAPGAEETEQCRPFVGKAGKQLDAFLTGAGLCRGEIFVTNAVKYRPFRQNPDTGRKANRPPSRDELLRGKNLLHEELRIVSPRIVATLGNSPLFSVLGGAHTVGKLHGQEQILPNGTILFPLYHPASVIYNRSLQSVYEEDLRALARLLDREERLNIAQSVNTGKF